MQKTYQQSIDFKSLLVLILTPLITIIFVPYYAILYGFIWIDWLWFIFFMIATGLSITMGYHRLWSHRAYKAHFSIKIFFILFGAAALQSSIIKWSSDHRKHHQFVDDQIRDPYAATKGFWYSHITWMFRDLPPEISKIENVDDLKQEKIILLQHRYYIPIAIFMCLILPTLIGIFYGRPGASLLLSGLLRLVLNHHFTFFINSLAHIWGTQTYSDENTARDNPLLSFLTYGEGYHNFHHKYPGDYRNGIKWYDFDPSKWIVCFFSKIGLTYSLKFTSKPMIEASKACMELKYAQTKLKKKKNLSNIIFLQWLI